jgi:hypothetical protein
MEKAKRILAAVALCVLSIFSYTPPVRAVDASSSNYGVSEVNFNSGGLLQGCSATYCAKQSSGETAVGATSGTAYKAEGGANTNREIFLEVSVNGGPINLGTLSAGSTKFGSTTFSVKNYLSSGYVVTLDGRSPQNKSQTKTLSTMSVADTSQPGTEQFGVNLRQNTIPAVGSDAQQLPDSTFSYGTPSVGYNSPNNFKYVSGDTIAHSLTSSGQTNYTMSVIENIATNTHADTYSGTLYITVIPTF